MRRITWINLILGIWLLVAPFAIGAAVWSSVPAANDIVLGILLIASSWWILAAVAPPAGVGWFQALCGIWLIIAPFVLRYQAGLRGATGNDVVCGIIALIIALVESSAMAGTPHTRPA